ncbi:MAG: HAD family phosphatase [Armatimonadetes bacterium]|nr:HAD family phosphatase [Armatimonadota bacterium]
MAQPLVHLRPAAPPRGAIFDMDGLLVDTEPVHAAAYALAFREAGLHLDPEEYRRHVTLAGGTIRDLYRACGGTPDGWDRVFARKCERFRQVIAAEVALLPGVTALLAALARRGTPCLLATGSSRFNADVVLGRFGLGRHFPLVLTGDDVRRAKPDPEVFYRAAAALGLDPGECVSFEDSPKGVRAAAEAGVPCVAVPTAWTRGGDFTGAALVLDSLGEVTPALLESLWIAGREL